MSEKVFEETTTRVKKSLEVFHVGVSNPIHSNSLSKNKYLFTYFLLMILVEKLKCIFLRKKNEFTSKEFDKDCENHGSNWPLAILHSP